MRKPVLNPTYLQCELKFNLRLFKNISIKKQPHLHPRDTNNNRIARKNGYTEVKLACHPPAVFGYGPAAAGWLCGLVKFSFL